MAGQCAAQACAEHLAHPASAPPGPAVPCARPADQCCAQRIHGVASGDTAGGYPRGVTATIHPTPGPATLPVRLHGSKAPAIALGLLMVLVVGVIELAIGEAHHLAGWWWAPVLMVAPLLWLMARSALGVFVRSEGDVLVVQRLFGRRHIPASTISAVHLAGLTRERVEVVRDTGRTWTFTAADSPAADREHALSAIVGWLELQGGPVPLVDGPLRDGERVGFAVDAATLAVQGYAMAVELVLLAFCVHRLHRDGTGHWQGLVAAGLAAYSLLVVAALLRRVALLCRPCMQVDGDVLLVQRAFLAPRRLRARDVDCVQVTMRDNVPSVRVHTGQGWVGLPLRLQQFDHPRTVLRLAQWLQEHGAILAPRAERPGRRTAGMATTVLVAIPTLAGLSWLVGSAVHGVTNFWVALGPMLASLVRRGPTRDVSEIDPQRELAWSLQD